MTDRVLMGPGKPGKSWNFIMAFSRTVKSWKKATGPGKFWKFVKLKQKYEVYGTRTVRNTIKGKQ